jgi:chemotaxis protein MotA
VLAFVGILVVVASVCGGFAMAGGHFTVLLQPSEFVVIVGAAVGAMLIGQPVHTVRQTLGQLATLPKGTPGKQDFLDLLAMLAKLFDFARKEGYVALEPHINDPKASDILGKYPRFLADHHSLRFLLDNLELLTSGATVSHHDLESLLEVDIEIRHEEDEKPSKVISNMSDSLPGLGIVAAVLGIIVTMEHISGPPEEIGHHVAAALVGTFLGLLLSYGFFQGISLNLAGKASARKTLLTCQQHAIVAIQRGAVPAIAVEFARRSLPEDVRPGSQELAEAIRANK